MTPRTLGEIAAEYRAEFEAFTARRIRFEAAQRALLAEAHETGGSRHAIADAFGISAGTASHLLLSAGLAPHKQHTDRTMPGATLEKIKAMLLAGETNAATAKAVGLSPAAISLARARLGLPPKRPSRTRIDLNANRAGG